MLILSFYKLINRFALENLHELVPGEASYYVYPMKRVALVIYSLYYLYP